MGLEMLVVRKILRTHVTDDNLFLAKLNLIKIAKMHFSYPVYSISYFLAKSLLNLLVMVKGNVFSLSRYYPLTYQYIALF